MKKEQRSKRILYKSMEMIKSRFVKDTKSLTKKESDKVTIIEQRMFNYILYKIQNETNLSCCSLSRKEISEYVIKNNTEQSIEDIFKNLQHTLIELWDEKDEDGMNYHKIIEGTEYNPDEDEWTIFIPKEMSKYLIEI